MPIRRRLIPDWVWIFYKPYSTVSSQNLDADRVHIVNMGNIELIVLWCPSILNLFIFTGISRSSRHKRSATGAQRAHYRKKRKFELGRQPASTKLGAKRIHSVRVRGGNLKYRALRLESGNFAWGSEHVTRKTRIISVVCRFSVIPSMCVTYRQHRFTMHRTTSLSEPTHLSRVLLSRLMLPPSASGMNPMYVTELLKRNSRLNCLQISSTLNQ